MTYSSEWETSQMDAGRALWEASEEGRAVILAAFDKYRLITSRLPGRPGLEWEDITAIVWAARQASGARTSRDQDPGLLAAAHAALTGARVPGWSLLPHGIANVVAGAFLADYLASGVSSMDRYAHQWRRVA
jgi:hypothetical protein